MRKINLADTRRNRRKRSRSEKSNKRNAKYFVMTTVIIHKVKGTLGMPTTIAGRKETAGNIKTSCTSNSNVAIDTAIITAVGAAIASYSSALPSDRQEAYRTMTNMMENDLLAPFQKAADANPGMAVTILQSGGFKVTMPSTPGVKEFEAVYGTESGTILLIAPGGPENETHFHEWKFSLDGIYFDFMRSTSKRHTQKTGLVAKTDVWFTHELIVKNVPQGVSQMIHIVVI